jgi:hypothetical protein
VKTIKNKKLFIIIGLVFVLLIISAIIFEVVKTINNKPLPSLKNPCKQTPISGSCQALIYKFYFDQETQICKQFIWGGCGGRVPFHTMEECQIKCEENTKIDCSGGCPYIHMPSQTYCLNGTIISGGYNECNCPLPPKCVE